MVRLRLVLAVMGVAALGLVACGGPKVSTASEAIGIVKQTLQNERYLVDQAECLAAVAKGSWEATDDSPNKWSVQVRYRRELPLASQALGRPVYGDYREMVFAVHKSKKLVSETNFWSTGNTACGTMHPDFRPPGTTTYKDETNRLSEPSDWR